MAGGNNLCMKRPTRHSRRYKSRNPTNIESLPNDLIFRILLQLSTLDIYDGARLVCRKWYNIILTNDFVNAHLQHSISGLLSQSFYALHHPILLTMQQGRVEMSKFSHEFGSVVWPGCNGLILQYGLFKAIVCSPSSSSRLFLPRRHRFCINFRDKLVCTFMRKNVQRCAIFTVGVDNSWRRVCTQHLPSAALQQLGYIPVVTDGFMHWSPENHTHFLTLNIETEIITQVHVPQDCGDKWKYFYPSLERYLSMLVATCDNLWEVWEMKPELGEWTKLYIIDLDAHRCTFQQFMSGSYAVHLKPKGWLKDREVLIFSINFPTQVLFTYVNHKQKR